MHNSCFRRNGRAAPRLIALAGTAVLALAAPATGPALASGPTAATATHFVWTADSADTSGDSVFIDSAATNGIPSDLLFVTPNWTPGGGCGCVYDSHPIGVWYDNSNGEWAIFNEDQADMQVGESFNVLVEPVTRINNSLFVQEAISANTVGDSTYLNMSAAYKPNAKVQVTQVWNSGGFGGMYNAHPVGVWYNNTLGTWEIFNEDQAPMQLGVEFNVLINSSQAHGGGTAAVHPAKAADTHGDSTCLSNPLTQDDPGNVTFVTPNYDPDGKGGQYDDAQTGVWYASTQECVLNEDGSTLPVPSAYNLLMFSS
jgi:hypothetical protein